MQGIPTQPPNYEMERAYFQEVDSFELLEESPSPKKSGTWAMGVQSGDVAIPHMSTALRNQPPALLSLRLLCLRYYKLLHYEASPFAGVPTTSVVGLKEFAPAPASGTPDSTGLAISVGTCGTIGFNALFCLSNFLQFF
ncbi:hypothetical protein RHGRI_028189 [Rhododendron griersonianum]|uniref:Uncharacterized protein n=1 Tax=Rhododendron griersonianum TaxID=479676 RepID=A0AAV6IEU5_9ERIC|nr:hypothetical protein RHGRI_028189 [Rhododendron griersonianum]